MKSMREQSNSDRPGRTYQLDFSALARPADTPIIYVDTREEPALIEEIKKRGCIPKMVMLDIGDYIVSDRAMVERKTRTDFENSIIDGRLFDQALRVTQVYERVVYVIEGPSFSDRINRNALMAAVSSLILNFNISMFFTRDISASAELICALAKKEQLESSRTVLIKKPIKTNDPNMQVLYSASSIPFIGEKIAMKLLERFGTLQRLFAATEQELMEVEGVGKKRAREMAKFFRRRFVKIE